MTSRPATVGQLRSSAWESVPVKEEVRRNTARSIAAGEPIVAGVLGYEDTVLPQLENALLAGHDVIFLGERGQAKTRMIRSLTGLLDEWIPCIAGSEILDDPYRPGVSISHEISSPSTVRTPPSNGCTVNFVLVRSSLAPDTSHRRSHRRSRPHQGRRRALPLG